MSEIVEGIAEPESVVKEGITAQEFEFQRSKEISNREVLQDSQENQGEVQEESQDSEGAEPTEAQVSQEAENESQSQEEQAVQDVLSKIDLDSLSEEERGLLREKLIPGAQNRIGELTAKRKAAEEKLEEFISSKDDANPLTGSEIQDNPFSDLKDTKSIQEKAREINGVIEWAEDLLFDHSDYGPSDVVFEQDGKSMTKAEIREAWKQAKRSKDTYLPDQYQKIQQAEESNKVRQQYGQRAMSELGWLKDKESDRAKQFVKLASDSRLQEVYEKYPELGAQLPYLIAHGVNSMNLSGSKPGKVPVEGKKSFDLKPPKSPSTNAAGPEKAESRSAKAMSDLSDRFKGTGTVDDFVKLRTQQHS